jgi:hypothetical protein
MAPAVPPAPSCCARAQASSYLRWGLQGEHRGHSIVLQVLAVPKGAEALGSEVLGADDRVLLGLEVGAAQVQNPLLQQLGAAEREPAVRRGERSDLWAALGPHGPHVFNPISFLSSLWPY